MDEMLRELASCCFTFRYVLPRRYNLLVGDCIVVDT